MRSLPATGCGLQSFKSLRVALARIDASSACGEEDEIAYRELVEYRRAGVLLVKEELDAGRAR